MSLLANDGVGLEPEKRPFEVVILVAPELVPVRAAGAEQVGRHGGVFQRSPFPARAKHEAANRRGQRLAILLRVHQPATNHEHFAQILGQPLIDPEQPGFLRRVEVCRALAGRPAELAAPGMDIFMRDQVGNPAVAIGGVDEVSLAHAVDARREMLQSQEPKVVAARDQEVKLGVVAGPEKRTGLADHPAVELDHVGPQLESRGRFRDDVEECRRIGACLQGDRAQVLARDQGRIGQRIQGHRRERRSARP